MLNSNKIYNSTGSRVYIRRVDLANPDQIRDPNSILAEDFTLDPAKYQEHAPFYLSEFFVVSYLTSFINIATVVTHVVLWYGKDIVDQTKAAFSQVRTEHGLTDTHNRLMNAYKDIPEWTYAVWLLVMSILSVIVCQFTPFFMPWWYDYFNDRASIFAIALGGVMTIPIGIIQAVSGTQIGLNVLTEFIIGLLIPGQTIAVISFKSLGYNVLIQALALVADLKLAHYMHICPKSMVAAQLIGTLIGIFFNTAGAFFVLDVMKSPVIFVDPEWLATGHGTFLVECIIM